MKSYATPLLILSTLSGMHAAPTARLDSSSGPLAKKDTNLKIQHGTRENPLQTLYIHGPMDLGMNTTHLAMGLGPGAPGSDISVGDVNVDRFSSALGVAVIAAVVCAVLPGCPAYVAGNLGFSGAASAVETITAAAAAAGSVKVNEDILVKRDDTEDEKWGCTIEPGWGGACSNQAFVPGVITAIANADNADPTTYGSTYWQTSDPSDGTVFANWWHCTVEDGDCALIGPNPPTSFTNLGSAAGH